MHIDFKHTIWSRLHFNEDATEEKILKLLQNNRKELKQGTTPEELELRFKEITVEHEVIYGSGEKMSVSENHHEATIELYNDEQQLIWTNQNH